MTQSDSSQSSSTRRRRTRDEISRIISEAFTRLGIDDQATGNNQAVQPEAATSASSSNIVTVNVHYPPAAPVLAPAPATQQPVPVPASQATATTATGAASQTTAITAIGAASQATATTAIGVMMPVPLVKPPGANRFPRWYYVTIGKGTGVFNDWSLVHDLIDDIPKKCYKGCNTWEEAASFYEDAWYGGRVRVI